ncbi:MAG: hypothetical protein Q8R24_03595 [Legionellaceae bacterium]|nr:hypothetical protein [Legionellaceae bacterium]
MRHLMLNMSSVCAPPHRERSWKEKGLKSSIALLKLLGTPLDHVENVTIIGDDPILPSPFLIGEAGAAIIAAIGYISSELWTLKNHRTQKIDVTVKEAACTLIK